ncbi:MAG: class I SAM-dependent methyltransferase [Anaerolineae bacterium]|nr:class I SAM-dependent methyltransferase [Anaerolineae bacterium]
MPAVKLETLALNRKSIESAYVATPEWRYFSPDLLAQYYSVRPLILSHARGAVIDIGCGYAPFRHIIQPAAIAYHTLDINPEVNADYTEDVQRMSNVPSSKYDLALCLEVLEHVPNTKAALAEIHRILKPGGVLILSVPFLSRLHNLPHDYYRFTVNGLNFALEEAGFEVVLVKPRGGILAFLGHQLSVVFLSLLWQVPQFRRMAWLINKLFSKVVYRVDRLVGLRSLFPSGYVCLAKKI